MGTGSSDEGEGGPSFTALKQSIRVNGGIIHPIIVNREPGGKLIVVEGNTRVQIYREFRQEGIAGNWDYVPSIVYESLAQPLIDAIRLQAHLVGVRPWDPYSKGKYLNLLYSGEHLSTDQIVDFCGGDKREVMKYIRAYNDMEQYYTNILEDDQEFDPTRFSAFVELQEARVSNAIMTAGFTKTDFAKWVHERKLFPLNLVRQLPRILQNAESRRVFLNRNAQEALKHLDLPAPETALNTATLEQLARQLSRRINEIPSETLQRMKAERDNDEVAALLTAKDRLSELCDDIFGSST